MKRVSAIFMVLFAMHAFASAQPRAIGVRLGASFEGSYQHSISATNYVQADLGLPCWSHSLQLHATYNWILSQPKWTSKGIWDIAAGVGTGFGVCWKQFFSSDYYYENHSSYFYAVIGGNVSLSYTFWFPLQLSAEYRPMLGPKFGTWYYYDRYGNPIRRSSGFYSSGCYDFCLAARYSF